MFQGLKIVSFSEAVKRDIIKSLQNDVRKFEPAFFSETAVRKNPRQLALS